MRFKKNHMLDFLLNCLIVCVDSFTDTTFYTIMGEDSKDQSLWCDRAIVENEDDILKILSDVAEDKNALMDICTDTSGQNKQA